MRRRAAHAKPAPDPDDDPTANPDWAGPLKTLVERCRVIEKKNSSARPEHIIVHRQKRVAAALATASTGQITKSVATPEELMSFAEL